MSLQQINIQFYKTQAAEFILGSFNNKLCLLDYKYRKMRQVLNTRICHTLNAEFIEQEDKVLSQTKAQIDEYFMGERSEFDIPLLMVGSEFEKLVWKSLLNIPYGQTTTYSALLGNLDHDNTLQSVIKANGANSLALIVPCHRVLDDNGGLLGYGGGLPLKLKLLTLEQNLFFF